MGEFGFCCSIFIVLQSSGFCITYKFGIFLNVFFKYRLYFKDSGQLIIIQQKIKTLNVNRKAYLKSFSKQVTGIENLPIQILCKAYYKYFTVALKTRKSAITIKIFISL